MSAIFNALGDPTTHGVRAGLSFRNIFVAFNQLEKDCQIDVKLNVDTVEHHNVL